MAAGAEHVTEATGDCRHDEQSERQAAGSDVRHPAQISATAGVDKEKRGCDSVTDVKIYVMIYQLIPQS